MIVKKLGALSVALAFVALTSCGGDDEKSDQLGGAVGAACSADGQCSGYENPTCVSNVKPLEKLVTSTDPNDQIFRDFAIPFPGGYCSTTLENSCAADAECGTGACFIPFENVSSEVVENLNGIGLPFDVKAFSEIGICLKACQADTDCRADEGYKCMIPLEALVTVVDPTYQKKYCIQNIDVSFLLQP